MKRYIRNGQPRYAAFWIKNEGVAWWWHPDISPAEMGSLIEKNKGRLICLDAFEVNGQLRCAGVCVKNDGTAWWWNPDVDPASLGNMIKENKGMLICLRAYMKGGHRRYAAVWVKNDGTYWWWNPSVTAEELGGMLANNKGRLISLDTFVENGVRRYAAVWVKNDGTTWGWDLGLEPDAQGKLFGKYCSYPMDMVAYEEAGKTRLATVRYRFPIPAIPNQIPGLDVTASAQLVSMEANGLQSNNQIQVELKNSGRATVELEDVRISMVTSAGYVEWWLDPFMSGEAWAGHSKSIKPGANLPLTRNFGSPPDRTHLIVQVSGKGHYFSRIYPLQTSVNNPPPDFQVDPPVYLGMWSQPAEITRVWVGNKAVDWLVVAGQVQNQSGVDIQVSDLGMRLSAGDTTIIEKALPLQFYNWGETPNGDEWWIELPVENDDTLKGSGDFAHFINGMEVDKAFPKSNLQLETWLNYRLNGKCHTAYTSLNAAYFTPPVFYPPVEGTWIWGNSGNHSDYNAHTWPGQRWAIDLNILGVNGNPADDGADLTDNNSFYSFGENVYCIADGTVIELEFNRPDNNGKDPHPDAAGPNYIIVGHSDGSITAYYHLKQNSIKVSLNQTVKAGDLIAEVGNSAAYPPHLHLGYSGTNGFGEFTLRPMRF
ncbi:MAG: M23 family metallopeptidase [Gammaproteobacteria bacterium]|nr:M23 family metallopeptidase [Gammaproteobacteria bacterium]